MRSSLVSGVYGGKEQSTRIVPQETDLQRLGLGQKTNPASSSVFSPQRPRRASVLDRPIFSSSALCFPGPRRCVCRHLTCACPFARRSGRPTCFLAMIVDRLELPRFVGRNSPFSVAQQVENRVLCDRRRPCGFLLESSRPSGIGYPLSDPSEYESPSRTRSDRVRCYRVK